MQQDRRYIPPHMRSRDGSQGTAPALRGSGSHAGSTSRISQPQPRPSFDSSTASFTTRTERALAGGGNTLRYGAGRSHRHDALSSPAGDLRLATPRKQVGLPVDEMELIQSVSRSGGDGAEGDAHLTLCSLKDWDLQERFRVYIDERLDKHYGKYSTPIGETPASSSAEELESLSSIVLLFRKLREGVVASGRIDRFAIEVFESSATLAILAKHLPQMLSSLSGLVPGLYRAVDVTDRGKGRARDADHEANLDTALQALSLSDKQQDKRAEFARLLLLFHLVHNGHAVFYQTYLDLTEPSRQHLRSPFADLTGQNGHPPTRLASPVERPFLTPRQLKLPLRVSRILGSETFSPVAFFAVMHDQRATSYERAILSWATGTVRQRAWDILKKAYMDVSLDWAGKWSGLDTKGVEEWATSQGCRVENGRIKLR